MFRMQVKFFENQAIFIQKIKILSKKPLEINGNLNYQACNDKNCIPGESEFSFNLDGIERSVISEAQPEAGQAKPAASFKAIATDSIFQSSKMDGSKSGNDRKMPLWMFFLIAFGAGLIAILTPCVFPMIPMTVSFS